MHYFLWIVVYSASVSISGDFFYQLWFPNKTSA